LNQPDWGPSSRSIAFNLELKREKRFLHLMMNAFWEPLEFELPPGFAWQRWIDTFRPSPDDIVELQTMVPVSGNTYHVGPRSVVVLVAGGA
ncbi:MAG: hypothetical protein U0792_13475, partial [Gemmataceae bacterium]